MLRPALALLAVLLVLAGCSDSDQPGYDEEFEDDFLTQCTNAYGGDAGDTVCQCWYDAVSGSIDFEDLPPIDDLVGGDLDLGGDRLPGGEADRPLQELAGCVRALAAEPTLPPTTATLPTIPAPRPPPTTTTTTVVP